VNKLVYLFCFFRTWAVSGLFPSSASSEMAKTEDGRGIGVQGRALDMMLQAMARYVGAAWRLLSRPLRLESRTSQ